MASGRGRPSRPLDRNTQLSKAMSYLLRHGAEKEGFTLQDGGFLYVDEVLGCKTIRNKGFTQTDLHQVVETNDKKRFFMEPHPDNGRLRIRANQGHSVYVDESAMDMTPITQHQDASVVVHGTNFKAWESILNQGLRRMNRQHVHFAPGVPGDAEVVSGMRRGCQVLIYIDMTLALQDGLRFFRSANNVILSPGDSHGCIQPKYFKEVWQTKPKKKIL